MSDRTQAYAEWLQANQDKKGTPEWDTVADAYKTLRLEQQQPFEFSAIETIKNVPESFKREVENIVAAITDPKATLTGLYNVGLGALQKADPTDFLGTDKEKYAEALGQFYVDRYGSKEKFLRTLQKDPVGVMGDASLFLTGGATLAPKASKISQLGKVGAAIEPINVATNIALTGGSKLLPKSLAPKLYESAAKFGTTIPSAQRERMVGTALKEELKLSQKGLDKATSKIDDLGNRMDTLIQNATDADVKVPAKEIFRFIDETKQSLGGPRIEAAKDLAEINKITKDFQKYLTKIKATELTPRQLQDFKTDAYKRIDFQKAPEKPSVAKEETYKAMSKAAKESIEQQIPDISAINLEYGRLKELLPSLERSVARIENRDILGIGGPVKAEGGRAIAGDIGAGIGTAQSILEMPKIKSNIALDIYKRQNQPLQSFIDNNTRNALIRQMLGQQGEIELNFPGLLQL